MSFHVLGGGDDDGGFVSACPAAGDPAVCITEVTFEGEELSVRFTSHDVDLGADLVPVFFLTDVSEDEAASVSDRSSDWEAWGEALGLPLLLIEADGSVRAPFEHATVAIEETKPRRRHSFFADRRPRFLARRKTGRKVQAEHVAGREIIAPN